MAAALVLLAGAVPARASPDGDLAEAQRSYTKGDYRRAIALLTPLLYPRLRLSAEVKVLRARKLLGISYVFEKNTAKATEQFAAILSLRPDYQFDSLVNPEAAIELFERVKKRDADKLQRIRKRIEHERQKRLEEQRREEQRRRQEAHELVIERTKQKNSYWVNFVPFGAGQFQNGHRRKGYLLLTLQAVLGAVSVGSAIWHRAAYAGTVKVESTEARAVGITQVASGAVFLGALAYGVIDALAYYQGETVVERQYKRRPTERTSASKSVLSISLAPLPGSVTMGLSMRY